MMIEQRLEQLELRIGNIEASLFQVVLEQIEISIFDVKTVMVDVVLVAPLMPRGLPLRQTGRRSRHLRW